MLYQNFFLFFKFFCSPSLLQRGCEALIAKKTVSKPGFDPILSLKNWSIPVCPTDSRTSTNTRISERIPSLWKPNSTNYSNRKCGSSSSYRKRCSTCLSQRIRNSSISFDITSLNHIFYLSFFLSIYKRVYKLINYRYTLLVSNIRLFI